MSLPFLGISQFEPGFSGGLLVFFALIIGHALADYPLQGSFLAQAKIRRANMAAFFGGAPPPRELWVHALTAHALIHAGAVWWITGIVWLALVELVLHWLIDLAKGEGKISFAQDQLLHVACKALYATILALGWLSA